MIASFFDAPETLYFKVVDIDTAPEGIVVTLEPCDENGELTPIEGYEFTEGVLVAEAGIAVHKYGAIICPTESIDTAIDIVVDYMDNTYATTQSVAVGDIEFAQIFSLTEVNDGGLG